MTPEEKLNDPAKHLLMIVLGNYFKRELGGTTERAEILARKLISIMDGE